MPPPHLTRFLEACFVGANLLAWAAALDTPWLDWFATGIYGLVASICGLRGGAVFAAFLIAEVQESILNRFQLYFFPIISLLAEAIVGKYFAGRQLMFVLSGVAFALVSSWGLAAIFEKGDWVRNWSKRFWIRGVVLIAPFMFALATSTASFNPSSQAEALRFAIPAIAGFT